ncbi:hypothetical protein TNCV_1547101 [Trichonephila clavipes]|nr:hypothetical protein TNCV_1547101 [Trichonephila clavipes]
MCFLPPPLKKNSLAMGAYIPTPGRSIAPINIGVCHKNFPARKQGNDRRQRPLGGNSALVPDQSEEIKWTRFEKAVPLSTRLQLFLSCIQGSSERVQEFAARINKLGTQIFQSCNTAQNTAVRNANDQLLQSRFISGLRNDIRRFVLARDPINLDESISAALIEEQNMKLNQIANDERSGLSSSQTETSVISALTNKLWEINLRVGRLREASSVTARKTGGDLFNRNETVFKCFYCDIQGHRQAECRKKKWDERRANYQPPGEAWLANFLFSVTPALILSIGDMSISKNRLFAIITQPPGIRQEGHTRFLGIGVFNAILETTI